MRLTRLRPVIALLVAVGLAACGAPGGGPVGGPVQGNAVGGAYALVAIPGENATGADALAARVLDSLQARSFAESREFCGYLYHTPGGGIAATAPRRGTLDSCDIGIPPANAFASYHTHGAYDPRYDNEVPSVPDLESDFRFRHDGYVSTPGGRLWRVEYDVRGVVQLCGRGCLRVDPGFVADPADEASIRPSFTLAQIRQRAMAPPPGSLASPSGRLVRGKR